MKNRNAGKKTHFGIKIGLMSNIDKKPIMFNLPLSEMEFYLIERSSKDQKTLIISQIIKNLEKKGVFKLWLMVYVIVIIANMKKWF